jgi:hypothetical protein
MGSDKMESDRVEILHGITDAQTFMETSLCAECEAPARSWCDGCRVRGVNRVPRNNGVATPLCVNCEADLLICRRCQTLPPPEDGVMDPNEVAFRGNATTAQAMRDKIKQAQISGHKTGEPPICLRDPTQLEIEAYRLRCLLADAVPLPPDKLCAIKTPGKPWMARPIAVVFDLQATPAAPAAPATKWLVAHVDAQWRPGDEITLPVYGPELPPDFMLPPGVPLTWP